MARLSALLLLGLAIGGGYLVHERAVHQRETATSLRQPDESELRQAEADQTIADHADLAKAIADAKAKADAAAKAEAEKAKKADTKSNPTGGSGYDTPASCNEYTGNRLIGCQLMLQWGFGLSQMPCLEKMWTKESNWNPLSENKSSHSYGIPQALPADKMASYGSDWRTNPVPQIKWGLDYIKKRYGTPCGAWSFWQAHNWY